MMQGELYSKYAKYYDKIYASKDYKAETEFINWAIDKHKKSIGKSLLDVACGTGNHIQYLKNKYKITGLDINFEMLKLAKKKISNVKFLKGDMKTLDIKNEFDIILCMFAAIAYNLTYEELESTLKRFYKHLTNGGMILFDLHIHEDYFLGDQVWVNTVVEPDLKIARISQSPQKKPILDLDLVFLIKENGIVDFDIDQHQIGLFNVEKIKNVMENIGFKTSIYAGFEKKVWKKNVESPAIFIGVK